MSDANVTERQGNSRRSSFCTAFSIKVTETAAAALAAAGWVLDTTSTSTGPPCACRTPEATRIRAIVAQNLRMNRAPCPHDCTGRL